MQCTHPLALRVRPLGQPGSHSGRLHQRISAQMWPLLFTGGNPCKARTCWQDSNASTGTMQKHPEGPGISREVGTGAQPAHSWSNGLRTD